MLQHLAASIVAFLLTINECLSFDTRYRADDLLSGNRNKTCSSMTVSTTCCFIYYYIWNSTGSPIKHEQVTGGAFSYCYEPNDCYSLQMVPVEQYCEYEITVDGETTNKGTFGYDQSNAVLAPLVYIPDTLISFGDCTKQDLQLYVFSYPDMSLYGICIGYSLYRFSEIVDIEYGIIDAGHFGLFNLSSTMCNVFEGDYISKSYPTTYFILQNGITVDSGSLMEYGKSYGCPQQKCSDEAIVIQNLNTGPFVYNITENGNVVANGNVSASSSEEICIDTSNCNIISNHENGYYHHARYFLFNDGEIYGKEYSGNYYSYEFNSYRFRIGECKQKCDRMPVLSTTNRAWI